MKKCNKCEHEYADEFAFCPHCGEVYVSEQHELEQTAIAVADNSSLFEKKGGKYAKLAQLEHKKHYIQNALILLFSLILFVGSFFIGAKFEYEHYSFTYVNNSQSDTYVLSPRIPIKLNTIQFVEGTLSCMDSEETIKEYLREDYLGNAVDSDFYLTIADYFLSEEEKETLSDVELFAAAIDKISSLYGNDEACALIGEKLSQSDINYLKALIYYDAIHYYNVHSSDDLLIGFYLGFLVLALELCVMITSLVFSIMALVALIQCKQLKKPLLGVLLPLIFLLILVVVLSVNPMYIITDVLAIMLALSVLSVILLAAHKWLFEETAETFNVPNMAKKLTLLAIGLVACFVTLGTLFTCRVTDYIYETSLAWNVRGHELLRFMLEPPSHKYIAPDSSVELFVIMVYLFDIGALTSLITVVLSVCTRLHNNKSNALLVRAIMSMVMSIIAQLFIIVIQNRYGDNKYSNNYFNVDIGLSAGLFVSIAMCIALIVVDAAWKTSSKTVVTSEQNEAIAQTK